MNKTDEDFVDLRRELVALGLRTIGLDFSGSGDSGDINDVVLPDDPAAELDLESEDLREWCSAVGTSHHVVLQSYYGALCDFAWYLLAKWPTDWYNNDGGAGVLAVDLVSGAAYVQGGYYVTEFHDTDMALQAAPLTAASFEELLKARLR